jgi:TonB family protein
MRLLRLLSTVHCLLFLAACGGGGGADLGPPAGWTGDGAGRWWREGADTTGVFRDLETLQAMGVRVYDDVDLAPSVQERMVELYRTNPELVDSLFAEVALPIIERGVEGAGDRTAQREQLVTEVNREMARVYRQPLVDPASAPELVYPDSLRQAGVGGRVVLQVYVDAAGDPVALETVGSVHPTLDALAMRAAAGMDYTMPWVITGRQSRNVPGWVRVTIPYGA